MSSDTPGKPTITGWSSPTTANACSGNALSRSRSVTPSSSWTRSVPTPRSPSPGSTARRSCSIPGTAPSPSLNTPSASSKPIGCFPLIRTKSVRNRSVTPSSPPCPTRPPISAASLRRGARGITTASSSTAAGIPIASCAFSAAAVSTSPRAARTSTSTPTGAHRNSTATSCTIYKDFREHLDKINSYAQQGADDLAARGKKGGLALGVLHGIGRFLRIYLLKKGFLDGKAGSSTRSTGRFTPSSSTSGR